MKKRWSDQVKKGRDKWSPTEHSVLCSIHFEANCFEPAAQIAESLGLPKQILKLKPSAVPTLLMRPPSTEPPAKKRRIAYEKRDRARVSQYFSYCKYMKIYKVNLSQVLDEVLASSSFMEEPDDCLDATNQIPCADDEDQESQVG